MIIGLFLLKNRNSCNTIELHTGDELSGKAVVTAGLWFEPGIACHTFPGENYFSIIKPIMIRSAEEVKITGHNLNGRKFILNPVDSDTIAKTIKQTDDKT